MLSKAISKLNQPLELSQIIKISVSLGFLLIVYEFFYLDIYSIWWLSLIILPLLVAGSFIVWCLTSIIIIPFFIARTTWRSFLPTIVNGAIFLSAIYFFQPIRYLRIEAEFILKQQGFEQVVQMIEVGTLQSDKYGQANLPKEFQYLSSDNKVSIYKENDVMYVSFDTNAAIVFPKARFTYSSNQLPPDVDIRLRVYKINSHWYLISYL
jgi:hypothetical protein